MDMQDMMMMALREQANEAVLSQIKEGKLTLENDEVGIIPPFLAANLSSNPQIIEILECMAIIIMKETMEKEYVIFFLNKVREIANKEAEGMF